MAYTPITPSDPLSTSVGDINTAFNLCSTMFASATAPGTIQAYSNWIDNSGTDVLKIRNAGNTAWVNIYQLGSQTGPVLSDGTTPLPNSITIKSPLTIGTSYSLTLPADQGGANTFLKNNGSGVFSWSTVAGGVVDIGDLGDVTITAAATGEYLRYSSGAWVDSPLLITDLSVTSEARGDVIVRDASGFVVQVKSCPAMGQMWSGVPVQLVSHSPPSPPPLVPVSLQTQRQIHSPSPVDQGSPSRVQLPLIPSRSHQQMAGSITTNC